MKIQNTSIWMKNLKSITVKVECRLKSVLFNWKSCLGILILALLLPLVINLFSSPLIENFVDHYLMYYGTVLSLIPVSIDIVISGENLRYDRQKFEIERRESEKEKQRAMIKEQESKKEQCRPTFNEENGEVRLVMKESTLYLLDVYLCDEDGKIKSLGDRRADLFICSPRSVPSP